MVHLLYPFTPSPEPKVGSRTPLPFAPVPLYPEGVWGTCVAEGEGVTGVQVRRQRRRGEITVGNPVT